MSTAFRARLIPTSYSRVYHAAWVRRGAIDCPDKGDASPAIASVANGRCIVLYGVKKILKQRLMPAEVTDYRR